MAKQRYKKRDTVRGEFASGTRSRDIMEREVTVDGETMTEWQYVLNRIRIGSTLEQEAERVGLPSGTLKHFVWNKNYPERKEAYQEARKAAAELIEDELNRKAKELLEDGYIDREGNFQPWSKEMIMARDKGLFHLYSRLKYQDSSRYGDKTQIEHKHDISDDLRRRLEEASQRSKERARLTNEAGPVIDVEWTELPQKQEATAREDQPSKGEGS